MMRKPIRMTGVSLTAKPAPEVPSPDRIYFRFIRLQQRVFGEMTQTLKPLGLSIPQFDVLSTLTEQEGLSQSDLAARLYVTKGNVSGLIDRLVDAGYVERHASPADRRSHSLRLTEAGRAKALEGIRLQRAFVAETLGKLAPSDLQRLDGSITAWRESIKLVASQKTP
jgi:MarR family transcriptional regulator, organic hydroperoxide resistance regulator